MPTIELSAFDTLFVRDGKPFSMGEDVWASGIFPPPPSVIYGALRTAYFGEHPEKLEQANTKDDQTQGLEIKRYGLRLRKDNGWHRIFPCPADIVQVEDKKENIRTLHLLQAQNSENNSMAATFQLQRLAIDIEGVESTLGLYLYEQSELKQWLLGETETQWWRSIPLGQLWSVEPKIGIAKSHETGSSAEGMLYRMGMVRMGEKATKTFQDIDNVRLELSFTHPYDATYHILRIGGEGRAVSCNTIDAPFDIDAIHTNWDESNRTFRLYFATPAYFKYGWLPACFEAAATCPEEKKPCEIIGNWRGHNVRIYAAAITKGQPVGGFDMKERKPKPMQMMVAAGSVYYLEYLGDAPMQTVINDFHNQVISDDEQSTKQGFGLAFVGKIPQF